MSAGSREPGARHGGPLPDFTHPIHEANDCHEPAGSPAGGEFCSKHGVKQGDYLQVHADNGKKYRIRFKGETPEFIRGTEVDREGEDISRPGVFDERTHLIQKAAITKVLPLEFDRKYGTLKQRRTLQQRRAERAAGMRRDRLARGGVEAEKQRKRDFQMARGRQTQKLIKLIRDRKDE